MKRALLVLVALVVMLLGATSAHAWTIVKQDNAALTTDTNPTLESQWGCSYSTSCFQSCASSRRIKAAWDTVTGPYRHVTTFDGDAVGFPGTTRCELGRNESRNGENSFAGTFKMMGEGSHYLITWYQRFPTNLDITKNKFQEVAQLKPTQPYGRGCMTAPGPNCPQASNWPEIEVSGVGGSPKIWMRGFNDPAYPFSYVWSTPAIKNTWIQMSWDVVFSKDPAVGSMQLTVQPVGGTAQTSPLIHGQTLQTSGTATSGYQIGQSIPAHWRQGLYHDATAYPCPAPVGCTSEFAQTTIYAP